MTRLSDRSLTNIIHRRWHLLNVSEVVVDGLALLLVKLKVPLAFGVFIYLSVVLSHPPILRRIKVNRHLGLLHIWTYNFYILVKLLIII